jgi:hypothetical protein
MQTRTRDVLYHETRQTHKLRADWHQTPPQLCYSVVQSGYKCLGFYFFIELVLLFADRNDIAAKAHNLGNKESLHLCFSSSAAVLGNQQINLLWQRVLRFNDFKAYIGVLNNGATLASPAIIVKLR